MEIEFEQWIAAGWRLPPAPEYKMIGRDNAKRMWDQLRWDLNRQQARDLTRFLKEGAWGWS